MHRDAVLGPDRFTRDITELNLEATKLAFASLIRGLPVPAVAEIGHGRVVEVVAAAVRHHQPLLLVLGRTDAEGTPDELITSTALDLLRAAPYPLLIVPSVPNSLPAPLRLLLAVDGEPFTLGDYAGTMRHLLDALPTELTVLTVTDSPLAAQAEGEALKPVRRTGLLADLASPMRTRSSAVAEHPADGILQVAQPAVYDMVAVIARPRSFLGPCFTAA